MRTNNKMPNEMSLDYIENLLADVNEKLDTAKSQVKHGKLRIQRKKIKSQIMKKHKPKDYERERICKNAREKAHTVTANTKREISNDVRKGLKEGLVVVNPHALTLSEAYGFDFVEEACAYTPMTMSVTFFDKPEVTDITEGLDFGKTKTGRQRKGKAIGVAEGVFAPIEDAEGNSVFSRNNRLYESNFWCYQLENSNLVDRVNTRRMLGTIGHHDKKVDDNDLAEGKVSHVITNLEVREDETGRYLWGRLEILNTNAGRLLKEYYDNEIPLFVSSRGGGKLKDVAGQSYKLVDKERYYCECFDIVKEPGFLEACPEYHALSEDSDIDESLTVVEGDNNMPNEKIKCNIKADDSMEEIVRKIVNPMSESLAKLTEIVTKMHADMYETAEEVAEEVVEAPVEAVKEEAVEEPAEAPAEEVVEAPVEETPAEEVVAEEPAEVEAPAEEPVAEETPAEEPVKEEAEVEAPAEEAPVEEAPVETPAEEVVAEEPAEEPVAEEAVAEEPAEAPVEEAPVEEPVAEEPVKEEAEPAEEAPVEEAPVEEPVAEPVAEEPAEVVEEAKADEDAEEPAEEPAGTETVVDYQSAYEAMKSEVDEAIKEIEDLTEMFADLGKRHKEVVAESEELRKQLDETTKSLNSYLVSEKFGLTVEDAKAMLAEKSMEDIEKELSVAESQQVEEEVQAKIEAVVESIQPEAETKAPTSREIYSAFSANEKSANETVNESVEETTRKPRSVFSWFN